MCGIQLVDTVIGFVPRLSCLNSLKLRPFLRTAFALFLNRGGVFGRILNRWPDIEQHLLHLRPPGVRAHRQTAQRLAEVREGLAEIELLLVQAPKPHVVLVGSRAAVTMVPVGFGKICQLEPDVDIEPAAFLADLEWNHERAGPQVPALPQKLLGYVSVEQFALLLSALQAVDPLAERALVDQNTRAAL